MIAAPLLAVVALGVITPNAWSIDVPAVEWGTGEVPSSSFSSTTGYSFRVNQNISARALGAYDFNGDGFDFGQSHEAGLWKSDGTLLASATVSSSDPLVGHFRYKSITPVTLLAGNDYVVGAQMNNDTFAFDGSGFTVDSSISFSNARFDTIVDGTLRFPDATDPGRIGVDGANGYWGGNFLISTPESGASLVLLGVGVLTLAGFGWRSRMTGSAS